MQRQEFQTLTRRIFEVLSDRIVDGSLPPGAPVRQDRVAEEFGTSHVPVREAFRMLEAEGLVVCEPHKGVRAAPLDPSAIMEHALMRAALEGLALQHAAPQLTSSDLALAASAHRAGTESNEIAVWEAANRRFHQALLRACNMPRLLASIGDLHRASARYLFAAWRDLKWKPRSDEEHDAIIACLGAGNSVQAEAILRHHIIEAGAALSARLMEQNDRLETEA